jgi:hypothetical protein
LYLVIERRALSVSICFIFAEFHSRFSARILARSVMTAVFSLSVTYFCYNRYLPCSIKFVIPYNAIHSFSAVRLPQFTHLFYLKTLSISKKIWRRILRCLVNKRR